MNEIGQIDEYTLTLDNNYFNENIYINDDIKIIPIRIEKNINKFNGDDEDKDSLIRDTTDKIKIISIKKNGHCRYILYETSDMF